MPTNLQPLDAGKHFAQPEDFSLNWIPLILLNGWVVYAGSATAAKPQYTKDPMGFVHLRGLIANANPAGNPTMAILPNGFRPGLDEFFIVSTLTNAPAFAPATLAVAGKTSTTPGAITHANSGSLFLSLSGVTFRTA